MIRFLSKGYPGFRNCALALASAAMVILAFPDSGWWWLAWFAFIPFLIAASETKNANAAFLLGQLFGTAYFFGTCWWLAYAPIHYAGIPPILAYSLIFVACLIVGFFPAVFAVIFNVVSRRFGAWGFLSAPFIWVFSEYLRFLLTGNNWNAFGYSQAFAPYGILQNASVGGVYLLSFDLVAFSSLVAAAIALAAKNAASIEERFSRRAAVLAFTTYFLLPIGVLYLFFDPQLRASLANPKRRRLAILLTVVPAVAAIGIFLASGVFTKADTIASGEPAATAVVVQADVPMSPVSAIQLEKMRARQIELAEEGLNTVEPDGNTRLVVLPESPMNYMYTDDFEFRKYIGDFARKHNAWVLFNSAEPDPESTRYFNSAVMIDPQGRKAGQYDKVHLVPFGEAVPFPLDGYVPGLVGTFAYGRKYDILPVGDVKAGIMICFESNFGTLSRKFAAQGADVLIELTNDGYLGPTPVLRQHLANAVFRAVETSRPVLRATNIGITGYIDEKGQVADTLPVYSQGVRVWPVRRSENGMTFYVRFGDWAAWLSTIVALGFLGAVGRRRFAERRAV